MTRRCGYRCGEPGAKAAVSPAFAVPPGGARVVVALFEPSALLEAAVTLRFWSGETQLAQVRSCMACMHARRGGRGAALTARVRAGEHDRGWRQPVGVFAHAAPCDHQQRGVHGGGRRGRRGGAAQPAVPGMHLTALYHGCDGTLSWM